MRYDTRGQGLSTRGLDETHSLQAYERDLSAVVDRLQPEPVVLMGGALSSHVAVRYAVHHPERVRALVLYRTGTTLSGSPALNVGLAQSDWDLFLHSFLGVVQANESISPEGRRRAIPGMKESVNQADWLQYARVAQGSTVADELPRLRTATLVLATGGNLTIAREGAARVAALIPGANLVPVDESAAIGATAQPVLDFLATLPATDAPSIEAHFQVVPSPAHLSRREIEVLRLLAAGRSNQEIANELVISRNTVIRHVSNVFAKTGVANRTEASVYARDHGIG